MRSPGQTIEQSWIQRSNFARSNIVRPFGRPCWMVFVQHFLLDQVLYRVWFWSNIMPNNSAMLRRFAALPTKFYPETNHVGHAGQSRIAILFSSLAFSRHLQQRWRRKWTSWLLLMNSQRARNEKRDEGEASLEGFESRNFEQTSGSTAFKIQFYTGFICSYNTQHTAFCSFSWPLLFVAWHRHLQPQTAPVP